MLIAEVRAWRIGKHTENEELSRANLQVFANGVFKFEVVFCKVIEQETLQFTVSDLPFIRRLKKETHETRSVPQETINPGVKCLNTP